MPPHPNFTAAEKYGFVGAEDVDIIAQIEGPEVLAVFRHTTWSPAVVRIYDLDGRIHFEAWHDGHIAEARWVARAGVIVLGAVNSEVRWPGRVGALGVRRVFPSIVTAIRPEPTEEPSWISTPTMHGEIQPPWYYCILPPGALDTILPEGETGVSNVTGGTFRLWLNFLNLEVEAATGNVVGRVVDTNYYSLPNAPDPETVILGPLPGMDPAAPPGVKPGNN